MRSVREYFAVAVAAAVQVTAARLSCNVAGLQCRCTHQQPTTFLRTLSTDASARVCMIVYTGLGCESSTAHVWGR